MNDRSQAIAVSTDWKSAYYEEPYYSDRKAKLLPRLKRLGILALPVETRILDACCGRGEALEILQKAGFRNLEGIDSTPPQDLTASGIVMHHGDVQNMPFPDGSFDVVMNLHALHHMGGAEGVAKFLSECHRVLKPQGTLAILDFPASPQVRLLFWLLRKRVIAITGGLRNFARILDEEWDYLHPYLQGWPRVKGMLDRAPFATVRNRSSFLFYYRTMRRA